MRKLLGKGLVGILSINANLIEYLKQERLGGGIGSFPQNIIDEKH